MQARVTHTTDPPCACANADVSRYTLSAKLIKSEGKSEIPGGYQLKFFYLGNNACVIQATRNMSGIPKNLMELRKKNAVGLNISNTLWKKFR